MSEQLADRGDRGGDQRALAGKYLTFHLAGEPYGLQIERVQEIVGLLPITQVPRMPDYVRGIVNLRGRTVPTLDLRLKFGLPAAEDTPRTCIVIVDVTSSRGSYHVGIVVDDVADVVAISADDIDSAPEFGGRVDTDMILGLAKVGERITMLLDINRVVTGDAAALLAVAPAASLRAAGPAGGDAGPAGSDAAPAKTPGDGIKGPLQELLQQLPQDSDSYVVTSSLLDKFQQFFEYMQEAKPDELQRLFGEFDKAEHPLFNEVGMLVRNLHTQIEVIRSDIPERLGKIAEHDMVTASARLEHIVEMTESAANTTIDLSERMLQDLAQSGTTAGTTLLRIDEALKRDDVPDGVRETLEAARSSVAEQIARDEKFQGQLTEVLMAQGYQDLTGQIIQKIVGLLAGLETELLNLVQTFGRNHASEKVASDEPQLEGPLHSNSDLKKTQGDVDSLLESLGF